jgi:hypothetical protein
VKSILIKAVATEVLFRFFLDIGKKKNSSKRNPIPHCYSMHAEVGTQHVY